MTSSTAPRARPLLASLCLAAASALAQPAPGPAPTPAAPREGQRIDERRPERPVSVDLFGRPLLLTGSWEYSDEQRENFDLQSARPRDRHVGEHEVKAEARWHLADNVEVFVQAVGLLERRRTEGTPGPQTTRAVERGQTWVRLQRLDDAPLSLQLGRVALLERRGWWWDDDLDAVRLEYRGEQLRFDVGIGGTLARVSSGEVQVEPTQARVRRGWGQVTWRRSSQLTAELFWLTTKDRSEAPAPGSVVADIDLADESDLDARWTGLRFSGRTAAPAPGSAWPRLQWWVDAAVLRGQERRTPFTEADDGTASAGATTLRRLRSHAHDLGLTFVWPVALQPSFTLGHAQGSGGAGRADLDVTFRQTGLHENKGRIAGVKRVRYYGELLQPELSNLSIATLGAAVRLFGNTSVEALAHRYTQVVAADSLAGSRLSADPEGEERRLGHEIDLVLAVREWRQVEFSVVLAEFRPGAAFAANRRDRARSVELGVALNF